MVREETLLALRCISVMHVSRQQGIPFIFGTLWHDLAPNITLLPEFASFRSGSDDGIVWHRVPAGQPSSRSSCSLRLVGFKVSFTLRGPLPHVRLAGNDLDLSLGASGYPEQLSVSLASLLQQAATRLVLAYRPSCSSSIVFYLRARWTSTR